MLLYFIRQNWFSIHHIVAEAFDAVFAAKPKLYWIGCGKDDGIMVNSRKLKAFCDEKGYPATLYESEGGHIWRNWRVYLTIFAQKLFK